MSTSCRWSGYWMRVLFDDGIGGPVQQWAVSCWARVKPASDEGFSGGSQANAATSPRGSMAQLNPTSDTDTTAAIDRGA